METKETVYSLRSRTVTSSTLPGEGRGRGRGGKLVVQPTKPDTPANELAAELANELAAEPVDELAENTIDVPAPSVDVPVSRPSDPRVFSRTFLDAFISAPPTYVPDPKRFGLEVAALPTELPSAVSVLNEMSKIRSFHEHFYTLMLRSGSVDLDALRRDFDRLVLIIDGAMGAIRVDPYLKGSPKFEERVMRWPTFRTANLPGLWDDFKKAVSGHHIDKLSHVFKQRDIDTDRRFSPGLTNMAKEILKWNNLSSTRVTAPELKRIILRALTTVRVVVHCLRAIGLFIDVYGCRQLEKPLFNLQSVQIALGMCIVKWLLVIYEQIYVPPGKEYSFETMPDEVYAFLYFGIKFQFYN